MSITIKELNPDLWPDLERFFLSEKCGGCWCMNHRLQPGEVLEGELARTTLKTRVQAHLVSGILAFDEEVPVGWCAFDRMADLPGLDCGYAIAELHRNDIWSIHCLSALERYPRQQVMEQMVGAAMSVMAREGAKVIEAYPLPALPSDNGFSGTISIFEGHGFELKEEVSKFYVRMQKNFAQKNLFRP